MAPSVAAAVKAACLAEGMRGMAQDMELAPTELKLVTKPGVERWPVKTGADADVGLVGLNLIGGESLGAGIVETTIEELTRFLRPPGMRPPTRKFSKFHDRRVGPVETTVWRIECDVIAIKLEADGDYHLVLQGASGEMMVAESPTPRTPFLTCDCPWTANLKSVRTAIDTRLVARLSTRDFIQLDDTLVPRAAVRDAPLQPLALDLLPPSFVTSAAGDFGQATFAAKIKVTPARITGVGFFDRVHGQTGGSPTNGIELHPILKIEWLE